MFFFYILTSLIIYGLTARNEFTFFFTFIYLDYNVHVDK